MMDWRHRKPAWERVKRRTLFTDSCWLWQGFVGGQGHGQIGTFRDGKKCLDGCHRVSWEHHRGTIPSGLCVLHKCDVPNCVNPEHLFLGTRSDNSADKTAKGRALKGPDLPQTKLTPEKVRWIRSCGLTQEEMAKRLGVSQATVSNAKNGRNWGWVR